MPQLNIVPAVLIGLVFGFGISVGLYGLYSDDTRGRLRRFEEALREIAKSRRLEEGSIYCCELCGAGTALDDPDPEFHADDCPIDIARKALGISP